MHTNAQENTLGFSDHLGTSQQIIYWGREVITIVAGPVLELLHFVVAQTLYCFSPH